MQKVSSKFIKAGSILSSATVLKELAKDGSVEIRRRVAANESAPAESLVELSLDKDTEVRRNLAHNPNSPLQVIEDLARDVEPDIRIAVANATYTPNHVLSYLLEDKNVHVKDVAKKTLRKIMDQDSSSKDCKQSEVQSFFEKELERRRGGLDKLRKNLKQNMANVEEFLPDKLVNTFTQSVKDMEERLDELKGSSEDAFQEVSDACHSELDKLNHSWQILSEAFEEALRVYEDKEAKSEQSKEEMASSRK